MKAWIVELEPGVWLTDGDGDPSRTLVEDNAKRFFSRRWAKMALTNARKFRRKFINARIYTPNPSHQGTTHLVRRTLDGVVQIQESQK